jgi:hypothetical protein
MVAVTIPAICSALKGFEPSPPAVTPAIAQIPRSMLVDA